MTAAVDLQLRHRFGGGVSVTADPSGPPRVEPRSEDEAAGILAAAAEEGWRVAFAGRGGWGVPDGTADLVVSAARLDRIVSVDPGDLVATVEAGVRVADLQRELERHGVWLAADPPGAHRTVGSVLATGTAGPLRGGFGPVRDQVLGLSLITLGGRVVRPGGRVVKNVAGFDLAKLAVGTFGAFGFLASAHLRTRAIPRMRRTLTLRGSRDSVLDAGRRMLDTGLRLPALEVLSPGAAPADAWTLALHLAGSEPVVDAEESVVREACGEPLVSPDPADATSLWEHVSRAPLEFPVALRSGTTLTSVGASLDLLERHVGPSWTAVSLGATTIRWCGRAENETIARYRSAAAADGMPVVLERAPEATLRAVGHAGAYRPGVARITGGLRAAFDPDGRAACPLEAP